MTRDRPDHIVVIDLVRFASALLVVMAHYAALSSAELGIPRDWRWWSWAGWIGVEIFFVVSGYVIAASASVGQPGAFLRRRALRLVPVAWICASLTAVVLLFAGSLPATETLQRWAASMTFYPLAMQIDLSYWTLGVEIAFYLLIASRLANADHHTQKVERCGLALALVSGAFWVWRGVDMRDWTYLWDLALLAHGGFFAIGIALSGLHREGISRRRAIMLLVGLGAGIAEIVANTGNMTSIIGEAHGPWLPLALFSSGVIAIAAGKRLQRPLARIVSPKRLAFIGLMTYPLYLLHQRIGEIVIVRLMAVGTDGHIAMAAAVVLSLTAAAAIVRYAEPPLRRWLAGQIDRSALFNRRAPAPDRHRSASLPIG